MQTTIQIAHTLHNILHLVLILSLDLACLANGNVERDPDSALTVRHPARGRDVGLGHEADTVLAGVCGGEGEAAGVVFALVDDAVVIVEGLVDGDLDLEVVVDRVGVGVGVDYFGGEFACVVGGDELVRSRFENISLSLSGRRFIEWFAYLLPGCPWGGPRRSTLFGGHQRKSTRRWREQEERR